MAQPASQLRNWPFGGDMRCESRIERFCVLSCLHVDHLAFFFVFCVERNKHPDTNRTSFAWMRFMRKCHRAFFWWRTNRVRCSLRLPRLQSRNFKVEWKLNGGLVAQPTSQLAFRRRHAVRKPSWAIPCAVVLVRTNSERERQRERGTCN